VCGCGWPHLRTPADHRPRPPAARHHGAISPKDAAMNSIIILTVALGIIPAAAAKFGTDSRDLVGRDPRSLVA